MQVGITFLYQILIEIQSLLPKQALFKTELNPFLFIKAYYSVAEFVENSMLAIH